MDYKRTRERKKCLIQGTIKCDKKYYISFFLEHKTLESQPCHIFKQWVFLVMAASAVGGCFVVEDSLDELSVGEKQERAGVDWFFTMRKEGGERANTSFHMIYSC